MSIRNRIVLAAVCAGFVGALPAVGLAAAASASGAVTAAVNDPARPEADRVRDADRKPGELIALTGIHAGAKVAELWPGGGYFTRIFSKIVGPNGAVYALTPPLPANAPAGARDPAAGIKALAADPNYPNIKVATLEATIKLPEPVDFAWTSLNYHDMHNRDADLSGNNRAVFNALKPGGIYVVIDHAAETGSGARDTGTLHRIDPELVKKEVLSVGFKFVQDSDLLKHTADDHKKPSREVERGKSDQFVFIFQKPAA